jgi:Concanavalin A-like lectin/glucanases superfamily
MNRSARTILGGVCPALLLCLSWAAARPLAAQPFGAWMVSSPSYGYIQIPNDSALNPADAITIEAWVSVTDGGGCSTIVGKNYQQAWWVGLCGTTLRSYLAGSSSQKNGGTLDSNWNHIAVVYDGANRYHYINGEIVGTFPETGALPATSDAMRIASDVVWDHHPQGAIDEVRIWNVARTTDQIRSTINVTLSAATPGLVAVWSLDGSGNDALGGHNGSPAGGTVPYLDFPVALGCTANSTTLCFEGRFAVTASWVSPTASGVGTVVPGASTNSGLFWFFSPDNWEVLIKELNGCGLNSRRWIFSAATTDVHYRLNVLDVPRGVSKVYFNYQGISAPAVTDTAAFATCP